MLERRRTYIDCPDRLRRILGADAFAWRGRIPSRTAYRPLIAGIYADKGWGERTYGVRRWCPLGVDCSWWSGRTVWEVDPRSNASGYMSTKGKRVKRPYSICADISAHIPFSDLLKNIKYWL